MAASSVNDTFASGAGHWPAGLLHAVHPVAAGVAAAEVRRVLADRGRADAHVRRGEGRRVGVRRTGGVAAGALVAVAIRRAAGEPGHDNSSKWMRFGAACSVGLSANILTPTGGLGLPGLYRKIFLRQFFYKQQRILFSHKQKIIFGKFFRINFFVNHQ